MGLITTHLKLLNKLYLRPLSTFDTTSTTPTTIATTTTNPTTATTNPTTTPAVTNPTTATATATTSSPAPLPPSGLRCVSCAPVRAIQTHALPPVVRSTVLQTERRVLVDGFRYRQQQLRTPNLAPIVEPIRAAWRRRFASGGGRRAGAGTSHISVSSQTLYFMSTAVALHYSTGTAAAEPLISSLCL